MRFEIIVAPGVLIGLESEDDWFEYRLEHHPEFLKQSRAARMAIAVGKGTRLIPGVEPTLEERRDARPTSGA